MGNVPHPTAVNMKNAFFSRTSRHTRMALLATIITVAALVIAMFWHTAIAAPPPLPDPAPVTRPHTSNAAINLDSPRLLDSYHFVVHPNHADEFSKILERFAKSYDGWTIEEVPLHGADRTRLIVPHQALHHLDTIRESHNPRTISEGYSSWARHAATHNPHVVQDELTIVTVAVRTQSTPHHLVVIQYTSAGALIAALTYLGFTRSPRNAPAAAQSA